jgi:hypothetical protein
VRFREVNPCGTHVRRAMLFFRSPRAEQACPPRPMVEGEFATSVTRRMPLRRVTVSGHESHASADR